MGFRSTFTTTDWNAHVWPEWFVKKYGDYVAFNKGNRGCISAKQEVKLYSTMFLHFAEDVQRSIEWSKCPSKFIIVFLHECGGITRCQIEKDIIRWSEPSSWTLSDGVGHDSCYGCSDIVGREP